MAEKRLKSFVVIGDDDAKTTRVFYYIGSGKNRSADAMKNDALNYYEERFQRTWFPEISNERNYPKDGHEFNNELQIAVAEERAEYTRIPNFGDRWVVTPKVEDTSNGQSTSTEHEQGEAYMEESYGEDSRSPISAAETRRRTHLIQAGDDDRVGLPEDEDDYEDEARIFSPSLSGVTTSRMSGYEDPGDEDEEIEEDDENDTDELPSIPVFPAATGYDPCTTPTPFKSDELPALDYITPEATPVNEFEHDTPIQAIGGFDVPVEDRDKIPTGPPTKHQPLTPKPQPISEEEMEAERQAEIQRLREDPATESRGDTGKLRSDSTHFGRQEMAAL